MCGKQLAGAGKTDAAKISVTKIRLRDSHCTGIRVRVAGYLAGDPIALGRVRKQKRRAELVARKIQRRETEERLLARLQMLPCLVLLGSKPILGQRRFGKQSCFMRRWRQQRQQPAARRQSTDKSQRQDVPILIDSNFYRSFAAYPALPFPVQSREHEFRQCSLAGCMGTIPPTLRGCNAWHSAQPQAAALSRRKD